MYRLENNDKRKSVHLQFKHNHCKPNYIEHDLFLVEYVDAEFVEGLLY